MQKFLLLNIFFGLLLGGVFTNLGAQPLEIVKPEQVGMSSSRLAGLDSLILRAIDGKEIPGGVLLVGRKDKIVLRKAYGFSQVVPEKRKMKVEHIFDLASITKPMATAMAIMILMEQGKIRLLDQVQQYIPEFVVCKKTTGQPSEPAQLYHLLTHTSGLPAYTNAKKVEKKYGTPCADSLILHIARLPKLSPPGEKFRYSCLGFITLGEIVQRVSGIPLDQFVRENIYLPLGMNETMYCPPQKMKARIVPTEMIGNKLLIGTVHDPLAKLMNGVSGNAGLFSTVDDMAIFAQMMLQGGLFQGKQILTPLTVQRMTSIYEKTAHAGRGLGWDVRSAYSSNKGDIFSNGGYGHSGYTGTSIWIDPKTSVFIIFLTNRVHPNDKGKIVQLRSYIANVVAASIIEP